MEKDKYNTKSFWVSGAVTFGASALLLFTAVHNTLGGKYEGDKILAYTALSLMFALVSSFLSFFGRKRALTVYTTTLILGFLYMFSIFGKYRTGMSAASRLAVLGIWAAAGLVIGLIIDFLIAVSLRYHRMRRKHWVD